MRLGCGERIEGGQETGNVRHFKQRLEAMAESADGERQLAILAGREHADYAT